MANPEEKLRETTSAQLQRLHEFDVESLPREEMLGQQFSLRNAAESAKRLIDLYKRLPLSVLDDFPKAVLEPIESRTNADLKLLDELLKFDPASVQNPAQARLSLIERTGAAYSNTFPILYNSIAYSLYKTGDFGALETQARVALGNIQTKAARITKALEKDKEEAERILEEVRKVAAEQGVSQQAIYFQQSADRHDKEATAWLYWTVWVAIGVGVFAVASLFFHKISWLAPSDMYQTLQLGVSKVLVFAVLFIHVVSLRPEHALSQA